MAAVSPTKASYCLMSPQASPFKISHNFVLDTKHYLDMVASELNWGDLSNALVVDVGCGNPKVKLCELLVEQYPNIKKVIALDSKWVLMNLLNSGRQHPQIGYHYADIEDIVTLDRWKRKSDIVFSSHCFHQLENQKLAFQNVHKLLRSGGHAAFLFCLKSGYTGYMTELVKRSEWNRYHRGNGLDIPVTQFMNIDATCYQKMLEEIGFTIILCEALEVRTPFEKDEDWQEATYKLCQSVFTIPTRETEIFKEDLFDTYMKYNGRNEHGQPCQFSSYMNILVKKPSTRESNRAQKKLMILP